MKNYGTDLLVVNGEVIWEGDNLATVSGPDNVKQQAYLRSITELGGSLFYKDYGSKLRPYLSKPFTPENKSKAESEVRMALLRVGNANGPGWISQVLTCNIDLVTVDGKQVKMLTTKYILRGSDKVQEMNYVLEGV